MTIYSSSHSGSSIDLAVTNANSLLPAAVGNTLLHDGNIGSAEFDSTNLTGDILALSPSGNPQMVRSVVTGVSLATHFQCRNDNGSVGTISSDGTATSYNTSSDPRLKDFKESPGDELINAEFNSMFDCFRVFNWKSDPTGDLVWGFDAHECIDKKTNIGSEGEGPREMSLGEVYDTTPAVFEDQELPLLYKTGEKTGQPRLDSEGEIILQTVSVEVTPAIEHKVSPAGVDQSKAVPILLAKIEQLERRLTLAGL